MICNSVVPTLLRIFGLLRYYDRIDSSLIRMQNYNIFLTCAIFFTRILPPPHILSNQLIYRWLRFVFFNIKIGNIITNLFVVW